MQFGICLSLRVVHWLSLCGLVIIYSIWNFTIFWLISICHYSSILSYSTEFSCTCNITFTYMYLQLLHQFLFHFSKQFLSLSAPLSHLILIISLTADYSSFYVMPTTFFLFQNGCSYIPRTRTLNVMQIIVISIIPKYQLGEKKN